jgi:hypothetical protein
VIVDTVVSPVVRLHAIIIVVSACGYGRAECNEFEGLLRKSTMIIEHNYD